MEFSSLIHLSHWWLPEFFVLWQERCLSLNSPSDSTCSTPLPLVQRRLNTALLKRPKAPPTPRIWHLVAVCCPCVTYSDFSHCLSSFVFWGFFGRILNPFKLQILCVTARADVALSWGFNPIYTPGIVRIKYLFFCL